MSKILLGIDLKHLLKCKIRHCSETRKLYLIRFVQKIFELPSKTMFYIEWWFLSEIFQQKQKKHEINEKSKRAVSFLNPLTIHKIHILKTHSLNKVF